MVPKQLRRQREPGRRGMTIGRRVGKIGFLGRGMGAPSLAGSDVVHALGLRIDEALITEGEGDRERCRYDVPPRRDLLGKVFSRTPAAVVFPDSGQCVADILDVCIEERAPAVPRGLGSAGLGGAVPLRGGVVVDLSRLDKVVALDEKSCTVTVGAGCTWERIQAEAASKNLSLRSYPARSWAGTVGGWLSTGGYGVGTLAEGRFGRIVESLEVAVPSGLLVTAGHGRGRYCIESFTGTEGQLGVITALTFSLKVRPDRRAYYALGPVNPKDAVEALCDLAGLEDPPLGLRLLSGNIAALPGGSGSSSPSGFVLSMLCEGRERDIGHFREHLGSLAVGMHADLRSDDDAQGLFESRFQDVAYERNKTLVRTGEVLIGLDRLAAFVGVLADEAGGETLVDVQVVDRGLALAVTCRLMDRCDSPRVIRDVPLTVETSLAAIRHGGRPHGLGIWNSPLAKHVLGKERKSLKAIKDETDRLNILNPGKFFSLTTGGGLPVWGLTYRIGLRMIGVFG
jgi:FAD/FMN-containing dehydrogenase